MIIGIASSPPPLSRSYIYIFVILITTTGVDNGIVFLSVFQIGGLRG